MELVIDSYNDLPMNYLFDYCLTRIDTDSLDYVNDPGFSNIINNEDPRLDSIPVLYSLDTLSPAINAGLSGYAIGIPFDFEGKTGWMMKRPTWGLLSAYFPVPGTLTCGGTWSTAK